MAHFFPSYSFDLDRTLYFFTSGRFEYRNKGFDLALEALARLNHQLRTAGRDITIVMFIISRQPFRTIHPDVLNSKGVMEELRRTCATITSKLGERLFLSAAMGAMPNLNDLVDEYWRLRLRRTMQAWRTGRQPYVVTHDLYDSGRDEVLNQLRNCRLLNAQSDPVKVIYHPDFITPSNPLFGMEYDQFVRGCHLGLFPSYYEPWGYTPLECIAHGIPAVTSDLAGFGDFMLKRTPDCEKSGLWVIRRKHKSYEDSAAELADRLLDFVDMDRRDRIAMRFRCQNVAETFDWRYLARHYDEAHVLGYHRLGT
jgi:glycogen(starch) synthase